MESLVNQIVDCSNIDDLMLILKNYHPETFRAIIDAIYKHKEIDNEQRMILMLDSKYIEAHRKLIPILVDKYPTILKTIELTTGRFIRHTILDGILINFFKDNLFYAENIDMNKLDMVENLLQQGEYKDKSLLELTDEQLSNLGITELFWKECLSK